MPNNPQSFTNINIIGEKDDSDLIGRIKRRDPRAMGTLYELYGRVAYSVILRLVPERTVAEDLLAEVLVKAWNQIGRWQDLRGDDLGEWILVLARNHALEHLRTLNLPRPNGLPKLSAFEQPAVLQDTARARVLAYRHQLRRRLQLLSPEERQFLEYSCFEGLAVSAIAIKTGKPLGVIKTALMTALEKLTRSTAKR